MVFAAAVVVVHSAAALQVAEERTVLVQEAHPGPAGSLAQEETNLAVEHRTDQALDSQSQDQEEDHQGSRLCQSPGYACEEEEDMEGNLGHKEEAGRREVAEVGSECQLAVEDE